MNEGVIFAILGGYCLALIVILTVAILFLLMLMRTLQLVRERNQAMSPGLVWLNLVPCVNIVWPFLTVVWMARSLSAEFRDRGMHQSGEDYAKKVGLTGLIVNITAAIIGQVFQTVGQLNRTPEIVFVGIGIALLGSIVYLVCIIVYWVKIAGYRKELQESRGREGDEYDDRDDRYRSRGRLDDDDRPEDDDRDRDGDDGYRRRYD